MFDVYDKSSGKKLTIYAVRENDGLLQFLTYFGEWQWYDAKNFYAVQEVED